jgi:hypothetical protein
LFFLRVRNAATAARSDSESRCVLSGWDAPTGARRFAFLTALCQHELPHGQVVDSSSSDSSASATMRASSSPMFELLQQRLHYFACLFRH